MLARLERTLVTHPCFPTSDMVVFTKERTVVGTYAPMSTVVSPTLIESSANQNAPLVRSWISAKVEPAD